MDIAHTTALTAEYVEISYKKYEIRRQYFFYTFHSYFKIKIKERSKFEWMN